MAPRTQASGSPQLAGGNLGHHETLVLVCVTHDVEEPAPLASPLLNGSAKSDRMGLSDPRATRKGFEAGVAMESPTGDPPLGRSSETDQGWIHYFTQD